MKNKIQIKHNKKVGYIGLYPCGEDTVVDTAEIYNLFSRVIINQQEGTTFIGELKRMGYDLTTFKFSIEKK